MKRAAICAWIFVLLPVCFAELQNVVVNGAYAMVDANRTATIIDMLTKDDDANGFRLSAPTTEVVNNERWLRPHNYRVFENCQVPEPNRPKQYADTVRTFLVFYARAQNLQGQGQLGPSLFVSVDRKRELVLDDLDATWRQYLVNLSDYVGTSPAIRFGAPGLHVPDSKAEAFVDIGLPRIVTWHGPYYTGLGGITMFGRHGQNMVSGNYEWPDLRIKPEDMPNGHMIVRLYDFVSPSTLKLTSAVEEIVYSLPSGCYWLPLRMGKFDHTTCRAEVVAGEVEISVLDIIPDFTLDDDEALRQLEPSLVKSSVAAATAATQ